jgi:Pyruvate/2-oxoacid:ferredoxin oxidoreductase delta subunit
MLEGVIWPDPGIIVAPSRFLASIDSASCTACGRCVAACNTLAHSLADGRHGFEAARCVGCGLCVVACPEQAIRLVENPAYRPPASSYKTLALRLAPAKAGSVMRGKISRSRLGRMLDDRSTLVGRTASTLRGGAASVARRLGLRLPRAFGPSSVADSGRGDR